MRHRLLVTIRMGRGREGYPHWTTRSALRSSTRPSLRRSWSRFGCFGRSKQAQCQNDKQVYKNLNPRCTKPSPFHALPLPNVTLQTKNRGTKAHPRTRCTHLHLAMEQAGSAGRVWATRLFVGLVAAAGGGFSGQISCLSASSPQLSASPLSHPSSTRMLVVTLPGGRAPGTSPATRPTRHPS